MLGFAWFRELLNKPAIPQPASTAPPSPAFADLFGTPAAGQGRSRRHVVIVGNCFSENIQVGMSSVPAATRLFTFSAIPLHLRSLEDAPSQDDLMRATHVYAQSFGGLNIDRLRELVSPSAQVLLYPDVVLRSPWPFEGANGFQDDVMENSPKSHIQHPDGALARLRLQEPDRKKRIQRYSDLDFDWASKIDRTIEAQERYFASIDVGSDVGLGQFISSGFREGRMFYNSTHPSAIVYQHLCEYLWEKLDLPETVPVMKGMDSWRDWSLPVHPQIARRLGLKWADEYTRYRYGTLGDVTWREWVEAYVEAFG